MWWLLLTAGGVAEKRRMQEKFRMEEAILQTRTPDLSSTAS
jgi:hypothetical protein